MNSRTDQPPTAHPRRAQQDLTSGSIGRHLINLAIPSALTNLMTFSTTLVDMIWLGRVSATAIAAVALYNYFWFLFALLNMMIGNGSVALISRTFGADQHEQCRRVLGQTFVFKLIVAAVVATIGLVGQRWAYTVFGAEEEVIRQAIIYGTILYAATPVLFSTFTLKTGFRAIGDMRNLLYISIATMMINLVLDPFLIFPQVHIGPFPMLGIRSSLLLPGLGLGIAGAAWGTVTAFAVPFVVALLFFFNGWTFLKVGPRHFLDLSWDTARRIIRIGLPPALANFIEQAAKLLVGAAIITYGTSVFAGQGVNLQLIRLMRVMVMGVNISVITLVGQNLGALNPRRSERSAVAGYAFTAALMLLTAAACYFAAPQIARVFMPGTDPDSTAAVAWAVKILRINAFLLLPFGLYRVGRAAFQGSGDTTPALYSTLVATIGVQLPLTLGGVYWLHIPDPRFIWWVEAGSYAIGAVLLYWVFKLGRWKQHRV